MSRRDSFVLSDISRLGFTMESAIKYTKAIARNQDVELNNPIVRKALVRKGFAPQTALYLVEVTDPGTRLG